MWIQFLLLKFSTQFLYFLTSLQKFVSKLFAKYFYQYFLKVFPFYFLIFLQIWSFEILVSERTSKHMYGTLYTDL